MTKNRENRIKSQSDEKKAVTDGFFLLTAFFPAKIEKIFSPKWPPRPLNFVSSVRIVKSYAQKPVLTRKNVWPQPKLELFLGAIFEKIKPVKWALGGFYFFRKSHLKTALISVGDKRFCDLRQVFVHNFWRYTRWTQNWGSFRGENCFDFRRKKAVNKKNPSVTAFFRQNRHFKISAQIFHGALRAPQI